MVTGSMSVIDGGMMPVSEPPMTGAGAPEALGEVVLVVPPPPHAASSWPAAVSEKPNTDARTRSCRLVICPLRT